MTNINMLDLKGEFRLLETDVRAAIDRVLDHQRFIGGPEVQELEERLASMCGRSFGVAVSSGTDALLCAMMSLGVGPGDEVITSPFTFFATAGCIWRLGAKPVFVDIEDDTFNIDPGKIESAITQRTKAIVPIHLFGQCAEMDSIRDIARRHGDLPILEDAAQAIGATYRDKPAGSLGTMAAISFYPTKNLGGFGEGGMIVTGDEALAERCRLMRNHGQTGTYEHAFVGGNFRLDSLKAGVLLAKLKFFDRFQAGRARNAAYYDSALTSTAMQTPIIRPYNESVYHQYSILSDDRDALLAHLKKQGIGGGIYYPLPLHLQKCFAELGHKPGDLPVAEAASKRILSLPIHPLLTEADLERVVAAVNEFDRRHTGSKRPKPGVTSAASAKR